MLFTYLGFFYDARTATHGETVAGIVLGIVDAAMWVYVAIHFSSSVHAIC